MEDKKLDSEKKTYNPDSDGIVFCRDQYSDYDARPNSDIRISKSIFENSNSPSANVQPAKPVKHLKKSVYIALGIIIAVAFFFIGFFVGRSTVKTDFDRDGNNSNGFDLTSGMSDVASESSNVAGTTDGSMVAETTKPDTEESSSDPVIESTIVETEATPLVSANTEPIIIVDEPANVYDALDEDTYVCLGHFASSDAEDGIKFGFTDSANGKLLVFTLLDSRGVEITNSTVGLDSLVTDTQFGFFTNPYTASYSGESTALFVSVVNHDGRDYIVVYSAPSGLTGNKLVVIIERFGDTLRLVNQYTNIDGERHVLINTDTDGDMLNGMFDFQFGMEFPDVGDQEFTTGEWAQGTWTQILGLVYNISE